MDDLLYTCSMCGYDAQNLEHLKQHNMKVHNVAYEATEQAVRDKKIGTT